MRDLDLVFGSAHTPLDREQGRGTELSSLTLHRFQMRLRARPTRPRIACFGLLIAPVCSGSHRLSPAGAAKLAAPLIPGRTRGDGAIRIAATFIVRLTGSTTAPV